MKAEKRREEQMVQAIELFSAKGYYETHLEDVIRAAGVGKGTFYRHFKNKEELFVAILHRFLYQWESEVFEPPDASDCSRIMDRFLELTRRTFAFFHDHPDLCNIYLRLGPGLTRIFEPHMELFESRMLDYIKTYLSWGRDCGLVEEELDLDLAANMIAGAFLRVEYFYRVLHKTPDLAQENLVLSFFNILMKGILKK